MDMFNIYARSFSLCAQSLSPPVLTDTVDVLSCLSGVENVFVP